MKIGLVRHFKVKRGFPEKKFITGEEYLQWIKEYDASDIEIGEYDLQGIQWKKCFTSNMHRASKTAAHIYDGQVVITDQLREIRAYPISKRKIKLPVIVWIIMVRIAWFFNHKSQLESRQDVDQRINDLLDEILSQDQEDVLLVSHGGLMLFLRKELIRRGFIGPRLNGTPVNGKLYVYERS